MSAMRDIPVIFEDDEILIINKPAGVAVQGGKGIAHPLDDELSRQTGLRIHLVHRLDKETCGLMVVAKNPAAARKWTDLISSKAVRKEYTAVCFNEPALGGIKRRTGTISGNVVTGSGKNQRERSAVTNFTVEEVMTARVPPLEDGGTDVSLTFSRIRVRLGTGRTHQIRIHLASAGSPVCGDDRHGDFRLNRLARKRLGIRNLLLCSSRLAIPSRGGEERVFEIEPPGCFSLPLL